MLRVVQRSDEIDGAVRYHSFRRSTRHTPLPAQQRNARAIREMLVR